MEPVAEDQLLDPQYQAANLLAELSSKSSPALAPTSAAPASMQAEEDAEMTPKKGKKRGRKPIPGGVERRKEQNRVAQVSRFASSICKARLIFVAIANI